jgi:capsular polysaccharide transport system permease protein
MLKVRGPLFTTSRQRLLIRTRAALPKTDWLFVLAVVLPTALAIIYFGLIASDVYVSESQFVVTSPDKPAANGFGMLLKSTGFSNSGDETYAAQDFVRSRDALRSLNKNEAVAKAYSNPSVSVFDRFDPLGMNGSFEDLYRFYQGKVAVEYDTSSSIVTLSVRAFTPADAYRFNRQLLELSEALVNRLNVRSREDVLRTAAAEVRDAQMEARHSAAALAGYRNNHGVVDPEQQAKAQLDMISKLQDELIGARVQLQQLQSIAPDNPQVPMLQTRISGLQQQINQQMGNVTGSRRSLAQTAVQYEQLELERQYSDRRLTAAMNSLQDAEDEARRKQAYVERIAQPSVPDEAADPRRLRGIFATFILGLIAWAILRLLLAGLREHHG